VYPVCGCLRRSDTLNGMSWGLLGALLAALCYGVSSVLQAVAASRTETTAALDPRLLLRLSKQWPFIAAMGIDAVGFVASILALRTLPLFLVESAIAGSVGVTAVLAARFLHLHLGRGERAALVALCAGLVLLAVSAQAEPALATSRRSQWLLLAGALLIVALAAASGRFLGGRAGAGLAAVAGLSFGGLGFASRTLVVPDPLLGLVREPTFWAVLAYGGLGVLLFSAALQRGSVTTSVALAFGIETTVPALAGLLLLGDRARPGFAAVAVAGFALALGGSLMLAKYAEVPIPPRPPGGRPDPA